ncbi:efflux RND transporter permease subunit [Fluviispira multicolorata]|uniref:MMPL family transporter n=1 Tax=Fluviispira multicolorata TaxID=2654512 RepID=A0A833N6Q3_9BACT|nr:efflux RND transporter permease subunit [Fluviispira multicolorata]KAB8030788.1 MMPL family transporter [Fluviispira multicolorata]
MLLSKVSIKRPFFASILNILIIIFGLMAYPKLGIELDPNVESSYVVVKVIYNGSNPSTSEELLLKPMEESLKGISGIKNMYGSAFQNGAYVQLEFNLDININKAVEDVRNKVSQISFPKDSETPMVEKAEYKSDSFMGLSIASNKLTKKELSNYAIFDLKPLLQKIDGVGEITIIGAQEREIHIELNSGLINSMKLSPLKIKNEIQNQIVTLPAGMLRTPTSITGVSTYNIPNNLDSIAKMPLTLGSNNIIRVEDIANVNDSVVEANSYGEFNGNQSIFIYISKQSQSNMVNISKNIRDQIEKLNIENGERLHFSINYDESLFIKDSLSAVEFDLFLAAILTVLVVFIFLHDWRNTLICAVAIPTSIIGTFIVANYLNFTLNRLTLLALTLSIGILVDDAIVVIENIHRHRLQGKSALRAANDGTSEIGVAAIAVTLAIVSVFIPVAFMDGIVGKYFYEFGITVTTSVLISLFVAFTLVPMMSSRMLKNIDHSQSKRNKYAILFDNKFLLIQEKYQTLLKYLLNYKKSTLFAALIILIASVVLLKFVPMTLNIDTDDSFTRINYSLSKDTPLQISIQRGQEIQKYIRSYPGVESVLMRVGGNQAGTASDLNFNIKLIDPKKRDFTESQFMQKISESLKRFIQNSDEKVGFGNRDYPVQISLLSSNGQALEKYSKELIQFVNTLPEIKDASSNAENTTYEYKVIPNRIKAANLGVTSTDIANTLKYLYSGEQVGNFYSDGRNYNIKLMLPNTNTQSINSLASVYIPTQNGDSVLLSTIATIEKSKIDSVINHINGEKELTIKAKYFGKDLSGITKKIESYIGKTKPFGIKNEFGGNSEMLKEMVKTISSTLLLAVLFIFLVLCAQFENFTGPFSIMLSVPLAFSGAFIALLLMGQPLSINSMIGIIMLMGLVTKNAILLIEFAQQRISEGLSIQNALLEAAYVRFRPIMMTTLTMIVGMSPLIFGTGAGHEARTNMGITVIGGLISSTILTLMVVPCFYSILADSKLKIRNIFKKKNLHTSLS